MAAVIQNTGNNDSSQAILRMVKLEINNYECFVNFVVVMPESCYNRENKKSACNHQIQSCVHFVKRECFLYDMEGKGGRTAEEV